MSTEHKRREGDALILVYREDGWHAHVARYGQMAGGEMSIEAAVNADALEAEAWDAIRAAGWNEQSGGDQREYACPPELAAKAVFTGTGSVLGDYARFLATLLRDMPEPQPEIRLNPAMALERVKWIPSGGDWLRRDHASDVILMHEYLRRSALWAQALNLTGAWPFFSVAAKALPDQPRPDGLFQQFKAHEAETHGHYEFWTQWAISGYLHWSVAAKMLREYGLPAPYEPLIRLMERGGAFRRTGGMIEVGGGSIGYGAAGVGEYSSLPAWVWLDEGSLEWADRAGGH